jgi:hypothetical protein
MEGPTEGRRCRLGVSWGKGVVGTKGSFKCKAGDERSLYYTLAIKDDPGWPEGVNKAHKA